ncbi:Bardet-Biedl syndrome 7 protein homolog [Eumeta japonica]|uniref:Bardet-Biedl syndrome 7 protein homolog n=1 Tax=Eumeta variegata TaxID=151549 RepID=A0A4C1XLQ6_EUMVA|nr:Bardet-Biedl syndrome 7 protein homolog [Eumeta japonica]
MYFHFRTEIVKLEKQVANERERYQRNTRSSQPILSQPPLLDIECKLTGANQDGWQEIDVTSAVPLDMVFLYCATKLELQSDTTAVLSLCHSQDNTTDLLATVRCQAGTRHLNVRVRHLKDTEYRGDEAQRLLLYALPAGAPRVARLITLLLPVLPLYSQHEDPEVAEKQNRTWCLLRISGGFSVAEITSWLATALPQELPRPATTIVFARIHAMLGTILICRYQRGSAIFKSDNVTTIAILKDVVSQCSFTKGIRVDFFVDVPKNTVLFSFNRIEEQFMREYQKKKELDLLRCLRALDLDSTITEEICPHLCEEYKTILTMAVDSEENFIEFVDIVMQWYINYGVLSLHGAVKEAEKSELRLFLQGCNIEQIKETISF